jgi:hypothetical protein
MLRIPWPNLDERRKRKLMRLWWNWQSDLGEIVATVVGCALAIAIIIILCLAVIQIEAWLR